MRQEDRQVDGRELEREEKLERGSELVAEDEEQLRDEVGASALEREEPHTGVLVGALQTILGHEEVELEKLELSQREQRALEAVKTAVEGRDPQIAGFVYAEDRSLLLEQALAVLQPGLATLQQLGGVPFEQLRHDIAALREQLTSLEDAQEEVEAKSHDEAKGEDEGDKDDDDDGDEDEEEEEEGEKGKASTLTGPERPAPAKPPTSLGDPKEIAEAARPWWKRT